MQGVSVCCNIHIICHSRWINLLELAGNPQTRYAHKLIVFLGKHTLRLELIQVPQSQMQCLLLQSKGKMNVDQPVDQNLSHALGSLLVGLLFVLFLSL